MYNEKDNILSKTSASEYINRIPISRSKKILIVRVEDIDWIEAQDCYVKLHVGSNEYLLRETMHNLEERLNPSDFVRIHRSSIININRLHSMEPIYNGEYSIILQNGKKLRLSRTYKGNFKKYIRF